MKKFMLAVTITTCLATLVGCANTGDSFKGVSDSFKGFTDRGSHVERTGSAQHAPANPANVQIFYGQNKPKRRYEAIGNVTVSADNFLGMNRSEADIVQDVKEKAASLGGDAVIDANRGLTTFNGTVIRYTSQR